MKTVPFLAALMLIFTSCNAPGAQRADDKFDARVAKPAYGGGGGGGPNVVIDESHRNFHTASGRYQPFARLLTNDGYKVLPGREKFSATGLGKGDILVVSNACGPEGKEWESAFSSEEVAAVRDWVSGGGRLLLIADHWPMGGAAVKLSDAFGIGMSQGVTSDSMHCDGDDTAIVYSRENGLLGSHPILEGRSPEERVGRVVTFTGQSLGVPKGGVALLKLSATAADHKPREPKIEKEGNDVRVIPQYGDPESAVGRAQGVALEFGKGRVVVLAEAAMMTAQISGRGEPFGMNVPGNDDRQLALNIMHWLSGLD